MRHVVSIGLAVLLTACGSESPRLVSAVFVEGPGADGKVDDGEAIVLTFSEPVALPQSSRTGVTLLPLDHSLGFFEVCHATKFNGINPTSPRLREQQLVVIIEGGDRRISPRGTYGTDDASTGLSIDFHSLGLATSDGKPLVGTSGVIDLSTAEHDPASLMSAIWLDVDKSASVSSGDEIKLTWDRQISIGSPIKAKRNEVPDDLLTMPVDGDRLDDGRVRSRLEQRKDQDSLFVVLGSAPRLSPAGEYERAFHDLGSSTGLAVQGTSIRPHLGIQDALQRGVADRRAIDLGGGLVLFAPIRVPGKFEKGRLVDHTATSLPGGKVLISGGIIRAGDNRRPDVLDSATIYDVHTGEWSAPIRMQHRRWGHTATYFPGLDGRDGSADDFVLIAGGWDGNNETLASLEVIFPLAERPEFRICEGGGELLRRAEHTAHALTLTNGSFWDPETTDRCGHLILVGGLTHASLLNEFIEAVDVRLEATDAGYRVEIKSMPVERLSFPRAYHDSVLVQLPAGPAVLVYGGWGDEGERINPQAWTCEPLAAPELFLIDDRDQPLTATPSKRLPAAPAPGPRVNPRLIPLLEERAGILLVGGSFVQREFHSEHMRLNLETAYRLDLTFGPEPAVEFIEAGSMIAPRSDFATALLPNGEVLILGGESDGQPTARVEVFDPNDNEFEIYGARLGTPRQKLTATQLTEDEWLIIGGGIGGEIFNWPEW